jgi:SPX domain protein involved in polyphosphate accumulation
MAKAQTDTESNCIAECISVASTHKQVLKMKKKQLQDALMGAVVDVTRMMDNEVELVGFIKSIGCWEIFMQTQQRNDEQNPVDLEELKQNMENIKCFVSCPVEERLFCDPSWG